MPRPQKEPLRALTPAERAQPEQLPRFTAYPRNRQSR
jgi:hypothetical protein